MQIEGGTQRVFIVGLTGGIGSGKSAAADRFRVHNVTIVNADEVAREVVLPGTEALQQIADRFGTEVLNESGSLDRKALRAHVFDDANQRKWLESLLHPLISKTSDQRLYQKQGKGEPPYRILEAPLLLETNGQDRVNRVLLITADTETRIDRVVERDSSDRQQIQAILDAQLSDNEKIAISHDHIDNSSSIEALNKQIDSIHQLYCELAVQSQRD